MEEITKKNEKTDIANNVENTDNTYKAEKTGKLSSKHWAIIGIAAALVVIAGVLILFFGGSSAKELQKQLDLGQKYLEEMNYEEAVVAFEAAIEIDPMSVDAYLGLVEVYIRTGDFDTALEYARKGYEMTGDERLKEKIDMIESGNITASNGWIMRVSYYDADSALLNYLVYQRGEQGRVERVSLYDVGGILINEGDFQYNEEGKMTVGYFEATYEGDYYLYKSEREYDTAGNEIAYRDYYVDGTLSRYIESEYDTEGNQIVSRCTVYNEDGTWEGYQEDEYDSFGNEIACRLYNADGTLQLHVEYEYDTAGNQIAHRSYNADGTLQQYCEYEYDTAGNQIAVRWYNADGTLQQYYEYEYNTAGNQIGSRSYNGDGILLGYSEREYDDASGKLISERWYGGDGNLISETRYD